MLSPKWKYLVWSGKQQLLGADTTCPACGGSRSKLVHRKFGVTTLRECAACALRFRVPKEDTAAAEKFYADEVYKQGFTTDLPSDAELQNMLASHFEGTEKCFAHRIALLRQVGLQPGARILDFGCSWGYGSWQMREAGFEVFSYEIGRERARYAREKLGCTMISNLRTLDGTIDCFFSSHVVEHLPNPNLLFEEASQLLKPGGVLVCYCPNGATQREKAHPGEYHQNWGEVHPVMITPEYLSGQVQQRRYSIVLLRSNPWEWEQGPPEPPQGELEGAELLLAARR